MKVLVYQAQPARAPSGWRTPARAAAAEVVALGCSLSLVLALPGHTKVLSASWPSVDALRASTPKRLGACRSLPPAAPGNGDEGDR